MFINIGKSKWMKIILFITISRQMENQGIDTAPLKKQIYAEAIRNVIDQEILFQEAQKEGLEATKEEVKRYLLDIEAFKENGKFSKDRYLAFLSQVNLTPSFFEEILRKELSIRHLLTVQKVGQEKKESL